MFPIIIINIIIMKVNKTITKQIRKKKDAKYLQINSSSFYLFIYLLSYL